MAFLRRTVAEPLAGPVVEPCSNEIAARFHLGLDRCTPRPGHLAVEALQSANASYGTPRSTPSGFMAGSYRMKTSDGESFDVEIPAFSLDSPHGQRQIH